MNQPFGLAGLKAGSHLRPKTSGLAQSNAQTDWLKVDLTRALVPALKSRA